LQEVCFDENLHVSNGFFITLGDDAPRPLKPVVHSILLKHSSGNSFGKVIVALVLLDQYLTVLTDESSLVLGVQLKDDLRDCILEASGFIQHRDARLALMASRIMAKYVGMAGVVVDADVLSTVLTKGFVFEINVYVKSESRFLEDP
jgi:hypothetical protein